MSLLELLVVIAILMIGSILVVPSIGGILQSSRLSQSGETLAGQLRLARQHALTKNQPVEVRLLRIRTEGEPGESGRYVAYQYFGIAEDGGLTRKVQVQRLPDAVFIDDGETLSTLIGNAGTSGTSPQLIAGTQLGDSLPGVGTGYDAVRFRFLPDGSTDLPRNGKWFLTLHSDEESHGGEEPPPNYFTLQIDPSNGHVKTFRP